MMCRCVWLLAVLCAVLVLAVEDKRAEMGAAPFVLGSRYGRSPPRMLAPRNDRFFMGSRYGKRSGSGPDRPLSGAGLVCEFTGVFPLYRCLRTPRDNMDNRRGDDEIVNNEPDE